MLIDEWPYLTNTPHELKVWRYMDYDRFTSLLNSSALHFCALDKLPDSLEGLIDENVVQEFEQLNPERDIRKTVENHHRQRNIMLVNCWHLAETESVAMWKVYCKNNMGIAIQSTINGLMKSFQHGIERIHLLRVKYDGFDQQFFRRETALYPAANKLPCYSYENEMRLLYLDCECDNREVVKTENGVLINIKLKHLIESVCLSPNAPEGFRNLVEIIREKHRLKFSIHDSIIKDRSIHR